MTYIQPPAVEPTQSFHTPDDLIELEVVVETDTPATVAAASKETERSPLMRFFDSFLQEQNIKWVLGVGTAIVLGCSLMLVAAHWHECAPMWRHLIMLGYTTLIAGAGWWCYHRLHLQKTGTTLMALTVLLLPLMFLALHWVTGSSALDPHVLSQSLTRAGPAQGSTIEMLMQFALLLVTALITWLCASRIFKHFLRDSHPTFLASYLLLCFSGVALPLVPVAFAPISALALWMIASIGAIKVNRHVFWLVEEHRAPRIVGFFPIALLCGQFLMLFALHLAPHVAWSWMGAGCVLVAATILFTTDTLAKVFEQRTGNLVRPLPAAIILPLVLGLIICCIGVMLSSTGFPLSFALAPTAALSTVLLLMVARRTNHSAFVWAAMLVMTVAYQASPIYFKAAALQLMNSATQVLQVDRLPVAYYGLTYLPLIIGLMITAVVAQRRGSLLIAIPFRRYSIVLSVALLALAPGHVKAMAPVAIGMMIVFAAQTMVYRKPYLAMLAIASMLIAAFGAGDFVQVMEMGTGGEDVRMICMSVAALLLLLTGTPIDRILRNMIALPASGAMGESQSDTTHVVRYAPCVTTSRWLTVILAVCWTGHEFLRSSAGMFAGEPLWLAAGLIILFLLATHALLRTSPVLGMGTIAFAHAFLLMLAISFGLSIDTILSIAILVFIAQWCFAQSLFRKPASRFAQTFAASADSSSHVLLGLGILALGILLPGVEMIELQVSANTPWWFCRLALIAWGFFAAFRKSDASLSTLAFLAVLASGGSRWLAITGDAGVTWLPLIWAAIAAAALLITEVVHRNGAAVTRKCFGKPIEHIALLVLGAVAIVSLGKFTFPLRIAALIALAGLLFIGIVRRSLVTRVACFMVINWQLLAFTIVMLGSDSLIRITDLTMLTLRPIALPIALLAALSIHFWLQVRNLKNHFIRDLVTAQRILLGLVSFICLALTTSYTNLGASDYLLAMVTFAMLIFAQLRTACLTRNEGDVWSAQGIAALGVAYFYLHGIITFGSGMSMYVALAVGVALAFLAKVCSRVEHTAVITRPFRRTAILMPLACVFIGIHHHYFSMHHAWMGANCLALLLAAAFYFWHGMETGKRRFIVASAIILNFSMAMLWQEMNLTDPQFFMIPIGITVLGIVRLLRNEIPTDARQPLYYLGALIILVSPVFHILDGGSWIHMLSLMVLSVMVILAAIGFRVRPLVYAGTAFLIADIIAMIVVGSIDHSSLLWISGIGLGIGVVTLGAIAERNREELLCRLRQVSATLATWD